MVKIIKQENNGQVGILTDCENFREFISELSAAVANHFLNKPGPYFGDEDEAEGAVHEHCIRWDMDMEFDLNWIFDHMFAIAKEFPPVKPFGASVITKRLRWIGDTWPLEEIK